MEAFWIVWGGPPNQKKEDAIKSIPFLKIFLFLASRFFLLIGNEKANNVAQSTVYSDWKPLYIYVVCVFQQERKWKERPQSKFYMAAYSLTDSTTICKVVSKLQSNG